MKKPMVRSDSASEAKWRPKQPRKICLKKSGLSSVNELKWVQLSHRSRKSPPPMAAAGLLGPDLVSC